MLCFTDGNFGQAAWAQGKLRLSSTGHLTFTRALWRTRSDLHGLNDPKTPRCLLLGRRVRGEASRDIVISRDPPPSAKLIYRMISPVEVVHAMLFADLQDGFFGVPPMSSEQQTMPKNPRPRTTPPLRTQPYGLLPSFRNPQPHDESQ